METVKHGNSLREHSGQTGAFPIFVGGFPERLNLFSPLGCVVQLLSRCFKKQST